MLFSEKLLTFQKKKNLRLDLQDILDRDSSGDLVLRTFARVSLGGAMHRKANKNVRAGAGDLMPINRRRGKSVP
jgi:hypothetical protein